MMKKLQESLNRHRVGIAFGSLLVLSCLISFLMNLSLGELPTDIEAGQIAIQDIRADKDYEIIDEEATNKLKIEALNEVLPIFDWDDGVGREKVIEDKEALDPWKETGIMIRQIGQPDQPKIIFKDLSMILSLEEARALVRKPSQKAEIRPNLFLNESETRIQEEKALADIKPVIIKVMAGESIIRSGDHFEARHLKIINGILREKTKTLGRARFYGTFFFVSLFLGVFLFVLGKTWHRMRLTPKDLVFLGTLLLLMVMIERFFIFVSGAVRNLLPIEIPLSSFYAMVPIAAGTMIARFMLPLPAALFFAPVSAALAGILMQGSLNYSLFYLVGCALGIPLMANVRARGQILKVGLQLGLINAVVLLALDLVNVTFLTGVSSLADGAIRLGMAFLGGVLSAILVMILVPVFESLFNYLTPIKLLEYGSLNHPLLREMIVRAPGTYHHSHMVGTLAESACEAIGADSLFARVASYFHDIGKMKKSPYFIENQADGDDRHAALSPSMSALIICSHVKDGLEMAREHKLPERIAAIIPQHQGTKLISYFYNKAKELEKKGLHGTEEGVYRYPGPKPQTREAGVILLADTAEAATRSLKDRSPARLEEVVRNVINKNFIDGQLDECELTLKDLHTIAKVFVRILMGIYHQRVEYPLDAADLAARDLPSVEGHADKYTPSKPIDQGSLKEAPEVSPKNIHRIGGDRSRN